MMFRLCMLLLALLSCLGGPLPAAALTPPEIRLLRSDDPADWEKGVRIILPTDHYTVPALSVAALSERLPYLRPESQLLVMRKMSYALERDPRVVDAFRRVSREGEAEARQMALLFLDRHRRDSAHAPSSEPKTQVPPVWRQPLLQGGALLLVLAPLALGAALVLWGFRLLQLHRLLRHLPLSRSRSLTPGLVALRGEVQPCGEPLFHPLSDELCVYYVGAEERVPQLRFWLVDEAGRVKVDPAGMVMLSEDGLLLPGEEVHLLVSAERAGEGSGAERWLLRKSTEPRSAFERLVHGVVAGLFGFCAGGSISKMLFSDPRRCFWIWDDLDGNPFGGRREVALVVAVFAFAGLWLAVAALVATALLDRDLELLLAWLG